MFLKPLELTKWKKTLWGKEAAVPPSVHLSSSSLLWDIYSDPVYADSHERASESKLWFKKVFSLSFLGAASLCLPTLLRVKEAPCSRLQSCQHSGAHSFNNKNCTWEQKLQANSLLLSGLSQVFWVFLSCWLSSAGESCSVHPGLLPAACMVLPLPSSGPSEGTSSTARGAPQPRTFKQAAVSVLSNAALPAECSCRRHATPKWSDAARQRASKQQDKQTTRPKTAFVHNQLKKAKIYLEMPFNMLEKQKCIWKKLKRKKQSYTFTGLSQISLPW